MKLYLQYDKVAKSVVRTFLFENAEVCLRTIKNDLTQMMKDDKFSGVLMQLKDCAIYECDLIDKFNKVDDITWSSGKIVEINKVSDLSVFFNDDKTNTSEMSGN